MNIGIVVQIGLEKTCEFHYLSFADWKNRMAAQHQTKQIPSEIDYKIFKYIGIDSNPDSIRYCSEKYPENSPNFINAKIESMKDIQNIVQRLGIEQIDVLAVDVEGYEKLIFATDWHSNTILPQFITVEFHPQFLLQKDPKGAFSHFSSNIGSAGYTLLHEEITNKASRLGLTVEQQWLKIGLI